MDNLDGSDHYSKQSEEPPPSLLVIILDTHPSAWSLLSPTLPFSTALAHLLVFINAHLACNNSNQICIIAAHPQRAEFLYPSPPTSAPEQNRHPNGTTKGEKSTQVRDEANHYRPFLHLQSTLLRSLSHLLTTHTSPSTIQHCPSVALSGALTIALTYHNRLLTSLSTSHPTTSLTDPTNPTSTTPNLSSPNQGILSTRILILSLTGSLSAQYIPLTNTIFACQRLQIPISVAKLSGDAAFLEQASDSTRGAYINIAHPRGLLQYLMMAFLPDASVSGMLRPMGEGGVDFRAACFCHRRVVEMVFCAPPSDAICPTCGTKLKLGNYGRKPAVVVWKKKKRKHRLDAANGDTESAAAAPGP
ncbi:MAG: hypothetical protein Q9166_003568 [cf. Caloplaca sp. 2 TL-2023]